MATALAQLLQDGLAAAPQPLSAQAGNTVAADAGAAALCLLIPYAAFASTVKDSKRRAWFLTLITASVCGTLSSLFVAKYTMPFDASAQFMDARLARFCCTFFVVFLVLDAAVGSLHYSRHFNLFEGWVHHAVYAAFFALGLHWGYSIGYATTLFMELPTAILARGHCFPALRRDLPYGACFLAIRVLYNAYLLAQWFAHRAAAPATLWPCPAATLALHSLWFYKWCISYGKRRAKAPPPAHRAREGPISIVG